MTSQNALEAIAKDPDMNGQALRVFLYLCSRLDVENFIQIPQTQIVEEPNMPKARVSKAVALLESKQIITRGPKVGRNSVFRLNPNYGWKGNVTQRRKAQAEHLRVFRNDQAEQAIQP